MRAAKIDANQSEIVQGLRKLGASVAITSMVGDGFVDIICGFRGVNYMLEIKDGNKPPSQRKLTDAQVKFHAEWRGKIYVVNSLDDAINIIKEK